MKEKPKVVPKCKQVGNSVIDFLFPLHRSEGKNVETNPTRRYATRYEVGPIRPSRN